MSTDPQFILTDNAIRLILRYLAFMRNKHSHIESNFAV